MNNNRPLKTTPLTEEEIALVNQIRAKAAEVADLVIMLKRTPSVDNRFLSYAGEKLDEGFAILVDAVVEYQPRNHDGKPTP